MSCFNRFINKNKILKLNERSINILKIDSRFRLLGFSFTTQKRNYTFFFYIFENPYLKKCFMRSSLISLPIKSIPFL